MKMVMIMARTELRIGRYIIDFVPIVFLVLTAILCNQLNDSMIKSDDAMKLVSDMNRQRTVAEMRALKAEQQLANSTAQNSPGVVIITPDGKAIPSSEQPKPVNRIQREVSF